MEKQRAVPPLIFYLIMKNFTFISMLTLFLLMVSTQASAYDVAVENEDGVTIYYNYINDKTELEVVRNRYYYSGTIKIPNSVTMSDKTLNVTSIGEYAFSSCTSLTSITIPDGVTSIGSHAFEYCNSLTSVAIPSSVKSVGYTAFAGCFNLQKVIVKDIAAWCAISFDGEYSNPLCNNEIEIISPARNTKHLYSDENTEIKDLIIPDGVTSIGNYAFQSCSYLTSITIPNSVTSIGNYAFYGCIDLNSITIPEEVTDVGRHAFWGCSGLQRVIVKDIAAWCAISFEDEYSNPLYYAGHLYSDERTQIKNLVIPEGVSSIGNYAFIQCSNLTSVNIPQSVTYIGSSAFAWCSRLTSISIPEKVTSIGNSAFAWCSGLTSITIPEKVTSIGSDAFDSCYNLHKVIVKNIAAWCGILFGNSSSNPLYYARHLYKDESTEIKDLIIPNGVMIIGNYAFYYCSLNSVTIPSSVTSIGRGAFYYCGLTSLIIPNSVTNIGSYALSGCNFQTIVSLIQDPFDIKTDVFNQYTYDNSILYVPQGTADNYYMTLGWQEFSQIVEGVPASIAYPKNATSNAEETERYTFDGKQIAKPQHGLNVVRMSDGSTKKVYVK